MEDIAIAKLIQRSQGPGESFLTRIEIPEAKITADMNESEPMNSKGYSRLFHWQDRQLVNPTP